MFPRVNGPVIIFGRTLQEHRDNADELSRLPWDEDASVKDQRDATLIQSVNIEPLSRDSLRVTQSFCKDLNPFAS